MKKKVKEIKDYEKKMDQTRNQSGLERSLVADIDQITVQISFKDEDHQFDQSKMKRVMGIRQNEIGVQQNISFFAQKKSKEE